MYLAGSPGSYFAYLKDCLKMELETRMFTVHGRTKILRLKLNIYYKIYNEPCV